MCLSIAIERPGDILAKGEHAGFEWQVIHNRMGFRCGYIRVPSGHPWYGKDYNDIGAEVHGELTFAETDTPCDKYFPDDGYWIGFDCAHVGDLPDPSLPGEFHYVTMLIGIGRVRGGEIRTQDYVESECRSLCEQASDAMSVATTALT